MYKFFFGLFQLRVFQKRYKKLNLNSILFESKNIFKRSFTYKSKIIFYFNLIRIYDFRASFSIII